MTDLLTDTRSHGSRGGAIQRQPRPARGRVRVARLLLGPVRRRADSVRARPVHDDRRRGRRQDGPAPLFGRLAAGQRRHGGLRVLRQAGRGRHVHAAAVADGDRPADAHDRAQGQVPAPAGRRSDAHLHLIGHGQRALRLDDEADACRRGARPAIFLNGVSYATRSATASCSRSWERDGELPGHLRARPCRARIDPDNADVDGPHGPRRIDPRAGPRRARADIRPTRSPTSAATRT